MSKVLPLYKTEYDLAKALIDKDSRAYQWFYDKFSGKMNAICHRYIADKMAAEDVTVESMMKVFDKVGQFNFNGSFEGWVKRIFVNESLTYLRKNRINFVEIEDKFAENVSTEIETNLESDELMKIIQELPTGFRAVFNLYVIEGYSHAEIGELLNISEGTSKSQLSRARIILRNKIEKSIKQY